MRPRKSDRDFLYLQDRSRAWLLTTVLSFAFLQLHSHSNVGRVKGAKRRYSEPSVVFVAFIIVPKNVCLHERHQKTGAGGNKCFVEIRQIIALWRFSQQSFYKSNFMKLEAFFCNPTHWRILHTKKVSY